MMIIDNKYEHGQMVYLKTDKEQEQRCVISFEVYKNGELLYKLACGVVTSYHYEFEISTEKDVNMTINA